MKLMVMAVDSDILAQPTFLSRISALLLYGGRDRHMINIHNIRHSAILEPIFCKCGKCSKCDKIKSRRKKDVIYRSSRVGSIPKKGS
jgi:hypothetical protein